MTNKLGVLTGLSTPNLTRKGDNMPKIKLKCLDVSPSGGKFTIGKLYHASMTPTKSRNGKIFIEDNVKKIAGSGYWLNNSKKLQSQGCEFQIIVGQ